MDFIADISLFIYLKETKREKKIGLVLSVCLTYIFFVNYSYNFLPVICMNFLFVKDPGRLIHFQHDSWVTLGPTTIPLHRPPFCYTQMAKIKGAKLQKQSIPLMKTVFKQLLWKQAELQLLHLAEVYLSFPRETNLSEFW